MISKITNYKLRITNLIVSNKYLLAIILLGLFLRIYKVSELFMYGHDNDLAGWFVKDVVVNHHLRLIGQETSTHGIFIGPIFYYLLIPFYLIFNMDPIGGVYLVILLGLFTIWSFYYVLKEIFNKNVGLISALIYSVSYYTVANDREVVPTMPVILWSIWFLYALNLLLKGKQKSGLILLAILTGLIWHLNMALILLLPIVPISLLLSKKKLEVKSMLRGALIFLLILTPFILFESRHGFSQIKSLFVSLSTDQHDILTGIDKVLRVIYLAAKDLNGLLWGSVVNINYELLLLLLIITGILLFLKSNYKKILIILFSWFLLYFMFFSLYSKIVSEYYLNGLITFYIAVLALALSYLLKLKSGKVIAFIILALFSVWNINRFLSQPINKSGYLERKAVISEIKRDSADRDFPCVSISYITDPGYDLGYRYFIWMEKLKTKKVYKDIPVYSIVFPMKPAFKTDISFGAIGLIYPEYEKFNSSDIVKSCEGLDYTIENPMFGFTE